MAFARRSLLGKTLQNVVSAVSNSTFSEEALISSLSERHGRAFSSLVSKWQESRAPRSIYSHLSSFEPPSLHHSFRGHHHRQSPEAFSAQYVRHVYVKVIDNDIDSAIKVYKRKLMNSKVEEKLNEKRYYTKPCERRKLAKHYKKLNRARRELADKIATVKHRMAKIQEVRRLEKEEKRAKAAAAAAEANATKSTG